jgi:UDP-N-acetylmuramate dehydrogenase
MIMNIEERLKAIVKKGEVKVQEPMKLHTTFRVGGNADYFTEPAYDEVEPLLSFLKEKQIPYTLIGNGSNLLVSDEGIRGVVISFGTQMAEVEVTGNKIKAQAGILLSRLASFAASNALSGLEFASGIPGTLGGAIAMNAGAYGGEMKDVVESVEVLEDGKMKSYTCDEMAFAYRHSIVQEKEMLVLSVVLSLTPKNADEITAYVKELNAKRIEKQPLNFPSAGSTFKRPEGYFAGKLIEDAGLRGYRVGGAQVSEKHCGFVVNTGDATAADIYHLILDVQKKVKEQFDVTLEPEVRMIGRFE